MILESMIEVVMIFFIFGLMLIFLFIRTLRRRKIHKLVDNQAFITNYFEDRKELYEEEYLPFRAKPINRLKNDIFMAKTFCIFLNGIKVMKVNYNEIYWAYGEVMRPSAKKKKVVRNIEGLVIKTLRGTYRVYLPSQKPYVEVFASMNIPTGYSDYSKGEALKMKEYLKRRKKEKKI